MDFQENTKLGRYEIRKKIGAGGMGEVYLATDNQLERNIALKVLPAEFCCDAERVRRFKQEARAASALNHPNIITIHEIGEVEDRLFIATEFIEGETLREKIRKNDLSVYESVRIAEQIAAGLSVAHQDHIIHRDIKPENIMIRSDGYAKILDFGLAKLVDKTTEMLDAEAETRAQVNTRPGMVMGSVSYMSPEQARGRKIDGRTDIWSLGVVLYEMLTGKNPFVGETVSDSLAALIHVEPKPLDVNRPVDLQRIVRKTLQKDTDKRYQTVKDLLIDLEDAAEELKFQNKLERTGAPNREETKTQILNATTTDVAHTTSSAEYVASEIKRHKSASMVGLAILLLAISGLGYWFFANRSASISQIESIAVMPFVNEGGNADVEYLSDGMTETLINSLSQLPKLSVKARSSVFRYKGKDVSPQTVGNELTVQAVLNGRVVQRGDNLTLSLELVDARTGNQIWGEQYNRKQTDLVALQSEIARDVSQKLRTRLSGAEEQQVAKTYTANPEAYQLYLQGLYHWHKRTPEDIRKSIALFRQATEKDSSYAQAYAGLALAYSILPFNSTMTQQQIKENRIKERAALSKVQELDDSLPEVHLELAAFKEANDWDFAAAEAEYKRAIELNPNYATARQWYSEFLSFMGRHEEAFAQINKAHGIDPFSRAVNANIGLRFYEARRFDEAIAQYKKVIEMEPNYPIVHAFLAGAYEAKGMYQEAIAERRIAGILLEEESAESSERKAAAFTQALKTGGAQGYWRKHLELSLKEYEQGYETAFGIAVNYARLGDRDLAFEWLEKSFATHEEGLVSIKTESAFDALSPDPRFSDLVRRIGLPQ
ncbi:MAG: protein kinase domain-containing protein [Pyrinomonadaceae bacterium]